MTTRDKARERLAKDLAKDDRAFPGRSFMLVPKDDLRAILSPDAGGDQGSSRDHALTDGVALDWRPIATAPRDGTEILIAIGSDYIGSAFYADDDSDPYPWKFFDRNGIKPLANGIRDDRMGPTHWMPLPAPPSSAKPTPDAVPGTNPKTPDKGGGVMVQINQGPDDFDVQWERSKRERRWIALSEDGTMFGLTATEAAEFARLDREFSPSPKPQEER